MNRLLRNFSISTSGIGTFAPWTDEILSAVTKSWGISEPLTVIPDISENQKWMISGLFLTCFTYVFLKNKNKQNTFKTPLIRILKRDRDVELIEITNDKVEVKCSNPLNYYKNLARRMNLNQFLKGKIYLHSKSCLMSLCRDSNHISRAVQRAKELVEKNEELVLERLIYIDKSSIDKDTEYLSKLRKLISEIKDIYKSNNAMKNKLIFKFKIVSKSFLNKNPYILLFENYQTKECCSLNFFSKSIIFSFFNLYDMEYSLIKERFDNEFIRGMSVYQINNYLLNNKK